MMDSLQVLCCEILWECILALPKSENYDRGGKPWLQIMFLKITRDNRISQMAQFIISAMGSQRRLAHQQM